MLTNIHPATSVKDAIEQLDSHIPLVHAERELIVQSLWDLAFREGAKQGRQAGYEAAQALDTLDREPRDEYPDPTTVIRDRLADKARQRDGG